MDMPIIDNYEQLKTLQRIIGTTEEAESTRNVARLLREVIERLNKKARADELRIARLERAETGRRLQ